MENSNLESIKEMYRNALLEFGPVPGALLWPKGRQSLRFERLTRNLPFEGHVSILDFGCGFGDLWSFIRQARPKLSIDYLGVDLIQEFFDEAKVRYPGARFATAIEFVSGATRFDYVFASGTFNLKYFDNDNQNESYVFSLIADLFEFTSVEMVIDFMRTNVDYRQPHAHHQDPTNLSRFTEECLSRFYEIDASYLPYEYCCRVLRVAKLTN